MSGKIPRLFWPICAVAYIEVINLNIQKKTVNLFGHLAKVFSLMRGWAFFSSRTTLASCVITDGTKLCPTMRIQLTNFSVDVGILCFVL